MRKLRDKKENRTAIKRLARDLQIEATVLTECATRWGTMYNMVVRFLHLVPAIFAFTRENACTLRVEILTLITFVPVLSAFVTFWKPFHSIQQTLQGDLFPTMGEVLPHLYTQASKYAQWSPTMTACALLSGDANFRLPLHHLIYLYPELTQVIRRYDDVYLKKLERQIAVASHATSYWYQSAKLYFLPLLSDLSLFGWKIRIATILTPAHSQLLFLPRAEKDAWYAHLDEVLGSAAAEPDPRTGLIDLPVPPYPDATSELAQYLLLATANLHLKAQDFWFKREVQPAVLPPQITKLFLRFCCIPASSASSERFFSLTGNTLTKKRNSTGPKRLQAITVAHRNTKAMVAAGLPDPSMMPQIPAEDHP